MGAATSTTLHEKVEALMRRDSELAEDDIRSLFRELSPAIRKKVKRVLLNDNSDEDENVFYDPAFLRGSLCEWNLQHQIENNGKLPPIQEAIQEDMRKAREYNNRPVDLPAIHHRSSENGTGASEGYQPPPEAYPDYDNGVPRGEVINVEGFIGYVDDMAGHDPNSSENSLYPGMKRDIRIYVPAQLNTDVPVEASLILFNDGSGFFEDTKAVQILDSLIHTNAIRITVAIFLDSGLPLDCPKYEEVEAREGSEEEKLKVLLTHEFGRKIEYDSPTDKFPRFVRDEVLPFVTKKIRERSSDFKGFSKDPKQRCIVGISSSGMQAFNMGWHHPDQWGRVLSHCGAFVSLNGGHNYPAIVRRSDRKTPKERENLKIVLTSGSKDNTDDMYGSFALANHTMADALRYAGYDYRYDFGSGGHDLKYAESLMADHLRWLLGGSN